MSCSHIHLMYAFVFNDNSSIMNILLGSSVTTFGIHLRSPHGKDYKDEGNICSSFSGT